MRRASRPPPSSRAPPASANREAPPVSGSVPPGTPPPSVSPLLPPLLYCSPEGSSAEGAAPPPDIKPEPSSKSVPLATEVVYSHAMPLPFASRFCAGPFGFSFRRAWASSWIVLASPVEMSTQFRLPPPLVLPLFPSAGGAACAPVEKRDSSSKTAVPGVGVVYSHATPLPFASKLLGSLGFSLRNACACCCVASASPDASSEQAVFACGCVPCAIAAGANISIAAIARLDRYSSLFSTITPFEFGALRLNNGFRCGSK